TNIAVTQPTLLNASFTSTAASCGNNNGSTTINTNGGTSGYTYSINNGTTTQTSNTFNGLLAGTYPIIVSDANGCTTTVNASVSNTLAPVISAVNSSNNTCFNSNNGSIVINASGGTGSLQYSINNGSSYQSASTFSSLPAGTYNVVVADALGCQASSSVTISQPTALTASAIGGSIPCFSGTTSVVVSANGGTAPYTGTGSFTVGAGSYSYTITDANGCSSITTVNISQPSLLTSTGSTTAVSCNGGNNGTATIIANGGTVPYSGSGTFSNLAAGTYTYLVTDANGCTSSTNINVSQPSALSGNASTTPASCGSNNGTASIVVSGGVQGYTYSINNGATTQNNGSFSNLLAGTYNVLITDANGCTFTITTSVVNTSSPAISSVTQTPNTCFNSNNGTINIVASGGTGALQYSINGGTTYQPNGSFINLPAGTYNISVTDALGCQTTSSTTITQPLALVANTSQGSIPCFGGTTTVNVGASGGTTPYTGTGAFIVGAGSYTYTVTDANGCTNTTGATISQPSQLNSGQVSSPASCNGGNNGSITITANGGTVPYSGIGTFTNLAAGTYNYTVTDANGCSSVVSSTVAQPSALAASIATTPSTCGNSDGSISVSASGGVGPYSFNATGTYQTSNQFSNVLAGPYTIIVQDANGCTFTASTNVPNQAAPSVVSLSQTNSTCFGLNNGSATITASGGTGSLLYSINGGTNFQNANSFNNLAPGTYQVVVSDANGCTANSSFTITQPTQVILTTSITNTICSSSNGSISISASGGTPTYQYSFNNGASYQANSSTSGIPSGTYNIVVSDANGCSATTTANVSNAPGPVVTNVSAVNVSCFGLNNGSAVINITSGTNPISYALNNGTTQTNGSFGGLGNGAYSVLVTDGNGCTANASFTITQPLAISATYSSTNSTCGNSDGSLTINPTGGTGAYSYSINNGNTSQNTPVFNLMPSGSYSILITDANGCTQTIAATINNSAAPVIQSSNTTNISCNGFANGSIVVTSTGGTGALGYSLNGGTAQTSGAFNNLGPGTYTVIVSDNNGCTTSTQAIITQPSVLTLTGSSIGSTCGLNNGSITLNSQGGTSPYSFSLNSGASQTNNSFPGLPQGPYGIVVTDANGCTASTQTTVPSAPGPVVNQAVATNVTCSGLNNGTIQIVSSSGTSPIQYSINGGTTFSTSSLFQNLQPGSYNIVVTDANGCTSTSTANVTQPSNLSLNQTTINSTCGQSDGAVNISATGGTSPYNYSINGGTTSQPSPNFNALPAGSYNLLITDANGCTISGTAVINNDAAPTISSSNSNNVTCFGLNNGTINVSATGGTGALSYSNNGAASQPSGTYNGLGPGIYNIVISDANGCTTSSQLTITEPFLLSVQNNATSATCGNNNGSITVTSVGGTGSYNYSINGSSNVASNSFNGLGQGSYNIVVSDQNGCTANTSATINNIQGPVLSAIAPTQVTCNGLNNGIINIAANGGTSPILYSINNGATTSGSPTFSNLAPGTYSILVTTANGCTSTGSTQITQPTALTLNSNSVAATCGSNNGSFVLSANGGTAPYLYSGNGGSSYQPG
ncbi:MAG: beta strand repeat-containing protein, partial [Bacteroidota bacterium]